MALSWQGVAVNGQDALALARSTKPHIILTDIRMPGMDGIELARVLQQELPATKIVLLTGYSEFSFAYSALQIGVAGFVLKPADPEGMVEAVLKAKKLIEDEEMREKNEGDLKRLIKETQLALRGSALPEQENAGSNQVIKEILEYIEQYYMENITLTHMGNHVHLSPVYLSRLMKKETGETFLDILTRVRISKAVELMKDPRIKTYEVAHRVGINDPRYFGQVFKKQFGITPLEFRKRQIG